MAQFQWPNNSQKMISREFASRAAAERYQNKLYTQYNSVHLVGWPFNLGAGLYEWLVC